MSSHVHQLLYQQRVCRVPSFTAAAAHRDPQRQTGPHPQRQRRAGIRSGSEADVEVVQLTGGAQALSGGVTPDSTNVYVGASDGKVHRVDLTKTPLTDAQSIAVNLCPSVTDGCNPDFLVVRPVSTVATLTSLAVTAPGNPKPTAPTLDVGAMQQFKATGTFSDKTTRDMTDFVTWSSSNTIVAVIGPTTSVNPPITTPGLAKGLAPGTATITASSAGVSSAAITLTVQREERIGSLSHRAIEPLKGGGFKDAMTQGSMTQFS